MNNLIRKNAVQRRVRQRLLVTLLSGTHFSGVLLEADRSEDGCSVFADVKLHPAEGEPKPAQGELVIRNSKIDYVQTVADVSV